MFNRPWVATVVAVSLLGTTLRADSGNDAFKRGVRAERKSDNDAAFTYYKQAYTAAPNNPKYFTSFARMRFKAATQHIRTGQLMRGTGALADAMNEFQRAAEIDTSSFLAQQELRRTAEMIRRQENHEALPKLAYAMAKMPDDIADALELQPISNAAIDLRMTANADVAYKAICKVAGINLLIDPEYRPQKITIDLTDVTLREALDIVRLQSKTFWRPVSSKTIFVTTDSPAKRKELEQNVMKTFYLRNITTPNELQEAANLVRQILDLSRVQLLQAQDALVLRGTKDQMILAEKLLSDFDKPKSEVLIDVAVMEVSRVKVRNIGTTVPTSTSISVIPGGASSGSGGGGNAYTFGSFMVAAPAASFTFLASDSNTKILQNPKIRALNDEKATIRIGDRVPIATGSFSPGLAGGSVSPLVSTQFQYLDVGVNVDLTPHIHSEREVTLKMVLEISSVTGSESIGGITQPIIGQRRIEHTARLADGDVNILGGILEESDVQSLSGYPWISKLPILKYFFGQDNRQKQDSEIVFAITPHIVRAQELTDENSRLIEVGTANSIELRRKPAEPAAAPAGRGEPAGAKEQAPPAKK